MIFDNNYEVESLGQDMGGFPKIGDPNIVP